MTSPANPTQQSVNVTLAVLMEVDDERARQDAKHGEQNHPDGTGENGRYDAEAADRARLLCQIRIAQDAVTWRDVLRQEVYAAWAETDPAKLRARLILVAAVATAWTEAIDRRVASEPTAVTP